MIPSAEFFVSDEHPMYAELWVTVTSSRRAILVHCGVHTGVCWTTRSSGQPGWAQHLAERDGWLTSSTGGESDLPAPARLQSTADHIVSALAVLLREKARTSDRT
jgi:hypothetical protein